MSVSGHCARRTLAPETDPELSGMLLVHLTAAQEHPPGAMLDGEQHAQAAQEHGIDMEEVGDQDRLHGRPGVPNCTSAHPLPSRRRLKES